MFCSIQMVRWGGREREAEAGTRCAGSDLFAQLLPLEWLLDASALLGSQSLSLL